MNTQDTCNPVEKQVEMTLKIVLTAAIQSLSIIGKSNKKQILRILEDMCKRMHIKPQIAYLEFLIEEALETDLDQFFTEVSDEYEEYQDGFTEISDVCEEYQDGFTEISDVCEEHQDGFTEISDVCNKDSFDCAKYIARLSKSYEKCQNFLESKVGLSNLPFNYHETSLSYDEIALYLTWDQLIFKVAEYLKASSCLQESDFVVDKDSFIFQWVKEQLELSMFVVDDDTVCHVLDSACLLNEESIKKVDSEDHPETNYDKKTDDVPVTINHHTITDVVEFLEYFIETDDSTFFNESLSCLLNSPELPDDFQTSLSTFYLDHKKYLLVFIKSLLFAKIGSNQIIEVLGNTVEELGFDQEFCELCSLFIIQKFLMEG